MVKEDFIIEIIDAEIINLSYSDTINPDLIEAYFINFSRFQIMVDDEQMRYIWLNSKIGIRTKANQIVSTQNFVDVEVSCCFEVENLGSILNVTEGKILSKDFIVELSTISYSTARGLLARQFKGTAFQFAILPIVKIEEIYHGFEKEIRVNRII